jgi:hypothetical protein
MNLSKNLTLKEAVKSTIAIQRGIKNEPEQWQIDNMKRLAENVFQPVRDYFGVPIGVSSMFRSSELNAIIGGATRSQHTLGQAMDMDADIYGYITNREIFEYIKYHIDFDQMIVYNDIEKPDFIHVSYKDPENNRGQILFSKNKRLINISDG